MDVTSQPTIHRYVCEANVYRLGRGDKFLFKNGQLTITSEEDNEQFQKLLGGLSPIDRRRIKTISKTAADVIANAHQAGKGQAVSGVQSSESARMATAQATELQLAEDMARQGRTQAEIDAALNGVDNAGDPNMLITEKVGSTVEEDQAQVGSIMNLIATPANGETVN